MHIVKTVHESMPDTQHTSILTDQDLAQGGLEPVTAFIRTGAEKSKNALRVQKNRLKAKEHGLRQLNVVARPEVHGFLKEVAKATQDDLTRLAALLRQKLEELEQTPSNAHPSLTVASKSFRHLTAKLSHILSGLKKAFLG
jgi:hypothetical protein